MYNMCQCIDSHQQRILVPHLMANRNRFRVFVLTSVVLLLGFFFLALSNNRVRTFTSSSDDEEPGGHQQQVMEITAQSDTYVGQEKIDSKKMTASTSSPPNRSPSSDGTGSLTARPSLASSYSYSRELQPSQHNYMLSGSAVMTPESAEESAGETFLHPVTQLPPLDFDHPSPPSLSIARLVSSHKNSQSQGDTPPDISFLPDARNLTNIPTKFKTFQNHAYDIPKDNDDINQALKSNRAAFLFMNYIRTMQVRCLAPVRLGNQGDGGWDVCITPPYNLERNCTVYSFGIGGDWSFDDAVVTKHQCNVFAFDPTIKLKEHKRLERISFFPLGLGGNNRRGVVSNLPLRTFKQFIEKFHHSEKVIDVVKIDIEYSEWQALDTMAHDGSLSNVKQLMFEIHTEELKNKQSVTTHFVYYWRILRNLHKLGFRLWHTHMNTWGPFMLYFPPKNVSCCYELYFLNINFMK